MVVQITEFDDFWAKCPRKIGKEAARKAYLKARKKYQHNAIVASLEIMKLTEWRDRQKEYIPHPSTFLNRESFEELYDVPQPIERQFGHHICDVCPVPHEWMEDGPAYNMNGNYSYACPSARNEVFAVIKKVSL